MALKRNHPVEKFQDARSRQGPQKTSVERIYRHKTFTNGRKVTIDKNGGLPSGQFTYTPGKCPCSVCGHDSMLHCVENDCQCCSSACT